ncbi:ATP-binding protein [Polycladidibacter hongkongensis]|uniref:ATP-binding protein n=1 Tax=Polycladidibacter hongkongensis TaxID=1647556 RepID=UPI000834C98E|nr:ATP-binding protein [Pseudovibrio hongkongensis]
MSKTAEALDTYLSRIDDKLSALSEALATLAGTHSLQITLTEENAYVFCSQPFSLRPVAQVNKVDLGLLQAVGGSKQQLLDNTMNFADGFAANNVLLWGAKGMGKSSLVKAIHAHICESRNAARLILIEIHREDISELPTLLGQLRAHPHRFIVFCDDLSFDGNETSYKSLKAALDGGIEGRPENVLFYATSNRRHLMPRDMMENERSTAINPAEVIDEKVSLSDRFGLWLGFHNCSQDDYLEMITAYTAHYQIPEPPERLRARALEWATTRGARSGRVAWQFISHLAGEHKIRL